MGLLHKARNRIRNHGAHIMDRQQIFARSIHQGMHVAVVISQIFCRGFTHMANAQCKYEAG